MSVNALLRRSETVPLALLALAFVAGALQSPHFLDADYLLSTTTLYVETGLIALAMTLVIVGGQIDLSVGSNLTFTACVVALTLRAGAPVPVALIAGPMIGAALGWINGALVVWTKQPSFVVTLGTMALYRGAAQVLMGPTSVSLPEAFGGIDRVYLGPFPVSLISLVIAAIAFAALLGRTVFGRTIYSVGGSESSSVYAGIRVRKVKIWLFVLAGFMSGLAALHIDSRLGVARYDHARGIELDAITAVVLGGASIYGGKGTVFGTVLALALLVILKTGMGLANVKAEYQLAAVGTLLVLAVISQQVFRNRSVQIARVPSAD